MEVTVVVDSGTVGAFVGGTVGAFVGDCVVGTSVGTTVGAGVGMLVRKYVSNALSCVAVTSQFENM